MSYVAPSALNMKLRFSEFASVDDFLLEFAIEEARMSVGDNWEWGQAIAVMYLAAHMLSVSQATGDSNGREVVQETIGRLSVTYKSQTGSAISPSIIDDYMRTSYGQKYLAMIKKQFPAVAVI